MQMLQSDWVSYSYTVSHWSAVAGGHLQNGDIFLFQQSFEESFWCKCITKFLKLLKKNHACMHPKLQFEMLGLGKQHILPWKISLKASSKTCSFSDVFCCSLTCFLNPSLVLYWAHRIMCIFNDIFCCSLSCFLSPSLAVQNVFFTVVFL